MKNLFFFFAFSMLPGFINAQAKTIIHFDSNKSELRSDAVKVLDSLIVSLKADAQYLINIKAYCDNTGEDAPNQTLSENRAKTVADYLNSKNFSKTFTTDGFGESVPIASNDDEIGKAKNRRAEITVQDITIIKRAPQKETLAPVPEDKKTFNEKSSLTDLEVGKTLVLKNLNFEGGTAVLLPEGKPTLEMLLRTMQENPTLVIEIGGHVCCFDDMPLSIYRAESVYKYLLRKGIDKGRMTYKGYSRNKPIFIDDKDESRARANRRVEITEIKK
ncbi:MAG: OmpA family protein [Bacteroidetes bacterium]|nr:OmpA family protein [Bacteroidota bacterium]